jgi:K+ transporter
MKQNNLFSKIESTEDALAVVRYVTNAFILIGICFVLVVLFFTQSLAVGSLLYIVFACILRRWPKIYVASLLLAMCLIDAVYTGLTNLGILHGSGGNIFLALGMLILAYRGAEATLALRRTLAKDS